MKITTIRTGSCKTNITVMVYVNNKYVGKCEKDSLRAYLKVLGYIK